MQINTDPAAIISAFAVGAFFMALGAVILRNPEQIGKHWMEWGMSLQAVKAMGWILLGVGGLLITMEALGLIGLTFGWVQPMS
jgi:hypothetical protein